MVSAFRFKNGGSFLRESHYQALPRGTVHRPRTCNESRSLSVPSFYTTFFSRHKLPVGTWVCNRDQWFWQNFIISMCGIKFWKGNKNLRSVYKILFFEILSGFFHFWPFKFFKKIHGPFWDENFFSLNMSNGASKNSSFRTDFKNVHLTLVKSAPEKVLTKKLFYQLKIFLKNRFFGQNFFWMHFLLRSYVHFWNEYEKTDYLISHST